MFLRRQRDHLFWSLKLLGLASTMRAVIRKATGRFRHDDEASEIFWHSLYRSVDRRLGIDTADEVPVEELDVDASLKPEIVEYMPTSPVVFASTISRLPIDFGEFVFVDFGSGKGRALFLAAMLGFKRMIGVELSHALAEQARANVPGFSAATGNRRPVEIVEQNATEFQLPPEPCLLYFFNPFGPRLMREVIAQIESSIESNPRRLLVIYNNPQHPECFAESRYLKLTHETPGERSWLIYESCTPGSQAE